MFPCPSSRAVQMFRTGAGILVQREGHTSDGLQQTFATNLFGHFVLVSASGNSFPLQWRHNEHDGVSNHQPYDCLLNRLFGCRSKKTSKLHATGLCAGNSPVTGEIFAQMASYAENISIWWRHHETRAFEYTGGYSSAYEFISYLVCVLSKFHIKYLAHTLKDMRYALYTTLRFKSPYIFKLMRVFDPLTSYPQTVCFRITESFDVLIVL